VSVVADVVGKVNGVSRSVTIDDVKGHPVSKRTLCLTGTRSGFFAVVILSCFMCFIS
jgi:hypothetical protein